MYTGKLSQGRLSGLYLLLFSKPYTPIINSSQLHVYICYNNEKIKVLSFSSHLASLKISSSTIIYQVTLIDHTYKLVKVF